MKMKYFFNATLMALRDFVICPSTVLTEIPMLAAISAFVIPSFRLFLNISRLLAGSADTASQTILEASSTLIPSCS